MRKGIRMMYQAGDTVIYGSQGVCRIAEISEQNYNGTAMLYYVLKPVLDERSTMYVPVHNEEAAGKLRSILSEAEVKELIQAMPDESTIAEWIDNDNARREHFKDILSRGERQELVTLIKTLYLHSQEQKRKGKRVQIADDRVMQEAEKMLYDEFAHVLGIKPEEVVPFIMEEIASN